MATPLDQSDAATRLQLRQRTRLSTGRQLGGDRCFCLNPPSSAVRVPTSERLVSAVVLLVYEGSSVGSTPAMQWNT